MGIQALIAAAGPALAKFLHTAGKAVLDSLKRNKKIVVAGGGLGGALAGGYAVGNAHGHKQGKVEGTIEQAKRDEKKIKDMQDKHEDDRHRWKETERHYQDVIKDFKKS